MYYTVNHTWNALYTTQRHITQYDILKTKKANLSVLHETTNWGWYVVCQARETDEMWVLRTTDPEKWCSYIFKCGLSIQTLLGVTRPQKGQSRHGNTNSFAYSAHFTFIMKMCYTSRWNKHALLFNQDENFKTTYTIAVSYCPLVCLYCHCTGVNKFYYKELLYNGWVINFSFDDDSFYSNPFNQFKCILWTFNTFKSIAKAIFTCHQADLQHQTELNWILKMLFIS